MEDQPAPLSLFVCENGSCGAGKVNYKRVNDHSVTAFRHEALNASLELPEGQAPWPSSLHGDIINAMICDGRVRPVFIFVDRRRVCRERLHRVLRFASRWHSRLWATWSSDWLAG